MRRLNRGRGNEKEKGSGVLDSFDVAREDGAIEERLERGGILEDEERRLKIGKCVTPITLSLDLAKFF